MSLNKDQAYANLLERSREIYFLQTAASLLSWDQETGLPPKGRAFRAEQCAYFSGRCHDLFTAQEVGDWIKACEDGGFEDGGDEAVNVREWRRGYERSTKIPTELVEEAEQVRGKSMQAWQEAREKSDFALFASALEKTIEINRRKADYWGFDECAYDALLETFEPGARAADITTLFEDLKTEIAAINVDAAEKSKTIPADLYKGHAPIEKQQAFNREVAEALGYDFEAGRIDTAVHPFCSGIAPGDVRLTTRYDENDFTSSLFGVMHEAGHGLYEQGLPLDQMGRPLGEAVSLGIHESQSRLYENHLGRSREFWEIWFPKAAEYFPHIAHLDAEQFTAAVNRAEPSFIRVEADEGTYDLHVILRFELETRIIRGELGVADIPAAWNELFAKLFGMEVDKDSNGCLQDIHWSMGIFGYFPTYTLGNLNASQLFRFITNNEPGVTSAITQGDYSPLLAWLRTAIHSHGKRFLPKELIERATGEPVQARYHLEHLRKRYT